jgi:hypothetical protein
MTEQAPSKERDLLRVLLEDAELFRYEHGGARLSVPAANRATGRELIADFYGDGEWREFFMKLIEDAGRAQSAPEPALALSDKELHALYVASETREIDPTARSILRAMRGRVTAQPPPVAPMSHEEMTALCQRFVVEGDNGDHLEDDGFHLAREVEGLTLNRCGAAQPPVPEWQPIETAPKDGTSILIAGGTFDTNDEAYGNMPFEGVSIARWRLSMIGDHWQGEDCQAHDVWYVHKPTHWMPLPSRPTKGETP